MHEQERLPTVPCPGCLAVGRVVRFEQPVDLRVLGRWMRVTATMRRCEACGVDWESTADPDWRPEAYAARRAEDAV